jgi:PAS domain S-box-containing protein
MNAQWQKVKTYWERLPIESRGSIAIAIPLVCLIGSVFADVLLRQKTVAAQNQVSHTNEVLLESQSILISLLNAETGLRGYYIGRQKIFLEPYDRASSTLAPTLVHLEQLVNDNPAQVRQVKLLTQIARDKMSHLKLVIEQIDAKEFGTIESTTQSLLKGKRMMDLFREAIAKFELEEYRLLERRIQALAAQQRTNDIIMWCEIAIGTLSTTVAIRLLRQLATELRQRELGLKESRNLLQTIVANIVDGVMTIDPHGKVTTFNEAAEKMFGYTATEAIGFNWQELLIERDNLTQKLNIRLPGSSNELIPTGKIWQAIGQRNNGEWFPIEVSINSIPFDDDLIAIVRDITERQQAKAKLQAKATELIALNASLTTINDCLIQKNRELDQFAYITSHDLKAPLRAIASLSEWIEEDLDKHLSVETRSQMQLLRNRVHRMQALLNGLLEYSRAGKNHTPISAVDVNSLLAEIIQTIAPPATFTINIVSPMPILDTRRQPLKQIFAHLIDNAIRHHPTKTGIVEISAIDRGDLYEFAIADNGDGIEPQFQERIYTIFQTLKPRDVQENIGAGLAIVKKITIAEGGTIQLESAAGNGAIFRFTWLKQPIVIGDSIVSTRE